jgi:hypothetical protein
MPARGREIVKGTAMALSLNLDVTWSPARIVHVRCVGIPLVVTRDGEEAVDDQVALADSDVRSGAAFRAFLTQATRIAPHGGTVRVVGLEPTIDRIPTVLDIVGPPPDPIVVTLVSS